jgi:hypothetical protein
MSQVRQEPPGDPPYPGTSERAAASPQKRSGIEKNTPEVALDDQPRSLAVPAQLRRRGSI